MILVMNETNHRYADYREYRRMRALELSGQGWKQRDIARALGVTEGAVSQWLKAARQGGAAALRRRPIPGARPKLTEAQRAELADLLDQGAEAAGFRGEFWTTGRIAALIRRRFGVRYHPAHVSRLVRRLGFSVQKPARQASQRDDAEVDRWWRERWPELKRRAEAEGRTIVFIDEAGFYLLPALVRTYARRGQRPLLRALLSRDHLSVAGALTLGGKLYTRAQKRAFDSLAVIAFLKTLLRRLPGKLLVIWDGATIHRSKLVQAFVAGVAGERLRVERLPGYAPELNPQEGVWNLLKRVELPNLRFASLARLWDGLMEAVARVRRKPHRLNACFAHAGYL